MPPERLWLLLGSFFALTGVAAGAFGAHGLMGSLSADALDVFETAARYQMYHALALIGLAALEGRAGWSAPAVTGWLFAAGILIFSGSLYLLAVTGIRVLGAITPIGGVCFLVAWGLLLYTAARG